METVLTTIVEVAIIVGAVTYTTFAIAYPAWARRVWWRLPVGRALIVSSWASALLLDLTLVFRVVEVDPLTALAVTCFVVVLIACGGLLKLGALAHEIHKARRPRSPSTKAGPAGPAGHGVIRLALRRFDSAD